ncbi:hypothetical protein ACWEPR_24415 [Streptomyces sp. NPDC004290]
MDEAGDAKPPTTAVPPTVGTSSVTPPPAAPGGDAGRAGIPFAEAIKQIPVAVEARDGHQRDSFKHRVDADKKGLLTTREEVLIWRTPPPTSEPASSAHDDPYRRTA